MNKRRSSMNTQRQIAFLIFLTAGLLAASLSLPGCGSGLTPTPPPPPSTASPIPTSMLTSTPIPPTITPTPLPTYSPEETSMKDWAISNFEAAHSPVNGDTNEHLIFGAIPVSQTAQNLAPELAAFLGRWEGYSYGPPVKKDWKFVLVIQEITARGGKAFLWTSTNLQYPYWVMEIQFRVLPGDTPAIEWEYPGNNGTSVFKFTYDRDKIYCAAGSKLQNTVVPGDRSSSIGARLFTFIMTMPGI